VDGEEGRSRGLTDAPPARATRVTYTPSMPFALRALDAATSPDFDDVMRRAGGAAARCLCTSAYVPAWQHPSLARPCRDRLLEDGRSDGYVLYDGDEPVGWCQAAPCDELPHFAARSREVDDGPDVYAVTCLVLVPEARRRGNAHDLLRLVLDELRRRGARRVHAFACRYGPREDTSEFIEFPESLCRRAGMTLLQEHPTRPMYGA
jgi:GNAT superfamily N-acetyltransferase